LTLTHISSKGLLTIAALVALLWGCVSAEVWLNRKARRDLLQAARQIHSLKVRRVMTPAAHPAPAKPAPAPKSLLG
jgi:hypothetical protein